MKLCFCVLPVCLAAGASLASDVWEMRRSVSDMITPAEVAADYVVTAILDDTVNGIVACDPMGADLLGVPLPEG